MMSIRCLPLAAVMASVPAAGQTPLKTVRVADGLDQPLFVTHAPGDYGRIFIVERGSAGIGRIKVMNLASGEVLPTPFIEMPTGNYAFEQGLLGMAFDPDYASNGFFYTYRIAPDPNIGFTMIERHRVSPTNPNIAQPGSTTVVLRKEALSAFHNAGWMDFGPDGFLYIAYGDNTQTMSSQDPEYFRAKIHRIDPDGDDFPADPDRNYAIPATNPWVGVAGLDETWAWGLRNPWRCSFDRVTGDLWIADVGLNVYEEVNLYAAPAGPPFTPPNFGWPCYEGPNCFGLPACNCASPFAVPVHYYTHGGTPPQCSVTGGYVYRGCEVPDLQGTYFFGDYCAARVWTFRYVNGQVTQFTDRTAELDPGFPFVLQTISSFGEDAFGELYICNLGLGEIYKIVPETPLGPDCNKNGRRDACDISSGLSTDGNANGIPDECECYANCNGSYSGTLPTLTVADFGCFQTRFVAGHPYADCNDDGQWTVADFGCFQTRFVIGCP